MSEVETNVEAGASTPPISWEKLDRLTTLAAQVAERIPDVSEQIARAELELREANAVEVTAERFNAASEEDRKAFLKNNPDIDPEVFGRGESVTIYPPVNFLNVILRVIPGIWLAARKELLEAAAIIRIPNDVLGQAVQGGRADQLVADEVKKLRNSTRAEVLPAAAKAINCLIEEWKGAIDEDPGKALETLGATLGFQRATEDDLSPETSDEPKSSDAPSDTTTEPAE